MDDILATIDAAADCHQCGSPLGGSPSDDFCRESCRIAWYAGRALILTPKQSEAYRVFAQTLFDHMRAGLEELGRAFAQVGAQLAKISEAAANPNMNARERALHLRRTRNTGPALPPLDRR